MERGECQKQFRSSVSLDKNIIDLTEAHKNFQKKIFFLSPLMIKKFFFHFLFFQQQHRWKN